VEAGQVVCEVGSVVNGKRRKLCRILSDPDARVIGVSIGIEMARFGAEHAKTALSAEGRRVVVADPVGRAPRCAEPDEAIDHSEKTQSG
jgi:putative resolvase